MRIKHTRSLKHFFDIDFDLEQNLNKVGGKGGLRFEEWSWAT